MNVLVTGATGFIGSCLAGALVRKGDEVTCLVRSGSDRSWLASLGVRFIEGDITQADALRGRLGEFARVYHLAGLTKAVNPESFFRVNADGTAQLVSEMVRSSGGRTRLVYLSSLAATGPSRDGSPVREDSEQRPVSAYGESKLAAEKTIREAGADVPYTIIRPPAVYGPRDRDFLVIFRAIQKSIFPSWGKSYYSLIYVEDLVRGVILAAEAPAAAGETFFLAPDRIVSNEEIASAIAVALGKHPLRIPVPRVLLNAVASVAQKIDKKGIINTDRMKDFSYQCWTCDGTKAARMLGFQPEVRLEEGIQWTANWYKIHKWL